VRTGQQYGFRVGAARQLGLLQGAEAYYGTDVRTFQEVDPWSKTSEAFGRFGATAGAGAGVAKLIAPSATTAPSTIPRTNAQLVQEIATRAEAWGVRKNITGTPRAVGTAKHVYARDLLDRYQQMFGDRGLSTEIRYVNQSVWISGTGTPTKGSVVLDVVEGPIASPSAIYDYKFGATGLLPSRVNQIRTTTGFQSTPLIEIRP
jgi:hypothetical protein